ncbi:phosphoglycerate mutase [Lasius niger]|uniref:Phosphoglycerate mutase n=1 Tax=Lasius niger TaxID=67767 RepID=A0A0J7L5M9_LASNI|nr:phosphoglycerate mutase [Lasius niger]
MHTKLIKNLEPSLNSFGFYLTFSGGCGSFSGGLSGGSHRAEILVRRIPVLEDLRGRHDYRRDRLAWHSLNVTPP